LLKEVISPLSRVAVLRNPDRSASDFKEMDSAARSLGLHLDSAEVREAGDFEKAFKAARTGRAQALITIRTPLINFHRKQVADLAIKSRLPAIYDERAYVDDDGLMSYGTSLDDLHRHAAIFVDKILKGRKPGDLPVEQPMEFEFIVNLKAAKQIGLTIPPNVLARADRVIK
jgi:putative ABC transport system substrate-binding protein